MLEMSGITQSDSGTETIMRNRSSVAGRRFLDDFHATRPVVHSVEHCVRESAPGLGPAAFRQPWIVLGRRYRYTITRMITQADIENMSREEKLRAMEALWQEISKEDPAPESPAWHGEVLEQTRSRVSTGTEQAVDWEEAKRRLRSRG